MKKRGIQNKKKEVLGMKNKKGITLIALIITIIVLLILAGVSLNAIVGDNGIITNAMNANFLQEMTSVQESFDMWKVNHYDDNQIPTNRNGTN